MHHKPLVFTHIQTHTLTRKHTFSETDSGLIILVDIQWPRHLFQSLKHTLSMKERMGGQCGRGSKRGGALVGLEAENERREEG